MRDNPYFKSIEAQYETHLPLKSYVIARFDGRSFHNYTKGLDRPFDFRLVKAMTNSAEKICSEFTGAVCAYTQSDEISVLFTDTLSENAQPMFSNRVQKIVSVGASVVTDTFNRSMNTNKSAYFDARVFSLSTIEDVIAYFQWRINDCRINAVSSVASSVFSYKQLLGKNHDERLEMLKNVGVNYEDCEDIVKNGAWTERIKVPTEISYNDKTFVVDRNVWSTQGLSMLKWSDGETISSLLTSRMLHRA